MRELNVETLRALGFRASSQKPLQVSAIDCVVFAHVDQDVRLCVEIITPEGGVIKLGSRAVDWEYPDPEARKVGDAERHARSGSEA